VLIVEDEALLRIAMSDYLQDCGFRTLEASSADEALQILAKGSVPIDVVVTDVRMPGRTDGFGLAKWARENRKGMPVIVVSGDIKKAQVAEELCAAEPFFSKPYDLKLVVAKIRQLLDKATT
jgi:DNA-binding response OmpR family regulator